MNLRLLIDLSLRAITANKLRSILTVAIIALGITALVGILTSIDSIKISLKQQFVLLGSNSFRIINKTSAFDDDRQRYPIITKQQAEKFKSRFSKATVTSIANSGGRDNYTVKFRSNKTNPNVKLIGMDENYLQVTGYNILMGRNISKYEAENNMQVVLVGTAVAGVLFDHIDSILGQRISIDDQKFKIVGVLESKGQSLVATDNQVMVPYKWVHDIRGKTNINYQVFGAVENTERLDFVKEEAVGVFRSIRKLGVTEDNNFEVTTSEKLIATLFEQLKYIRAATLVIGILTLVGAGIGLMNIMLVSVNERTREIGVSKALGAKRKNIFQQFLIETIVICQIGGVLGIIFGIAVGNLVSYFLGTGFIVPWNWMLLGLAFCFIVGLLAGVYPAIKAGRLNPVEALRYE